LARLLLVEDEAISRFQLAQFLTEEGYTVIPVPSGEEALKLFHTETFDVVNRSCGRTRALRPLTAESGRRQKDADCEM
jgi:DNA-binding NtrC family response regulator